MKLHAKITTSIEGEPFVALIEDPVGTFQAPEQNRLIFAAANEHASARALITSQGIASSRPFVSIPDELSYLSIGDIVRVNPISKEIRVLYRKASRYNVLFFTERCNSRCLMCSQPPRDIDDGYLVEDILTSIPWMAKDTSELGISGGEPTLLHDRLIDVVTATRDHLPNTALHMLSNGRLFCYLRYAEKLAAIKHPDFMVGIPVYAATADRHDFVVQAQGAFEQTCRGILNLGRLGVRVEIRMVIHRETYRHLPEFARFVARNFPFVDQVVFMGLELMGFAKSNLEALWIDPTEYQNELEEAVLEITQSGIPASIYNHALCLLKSTLHPYARRSISDWKNIYMPECEPCGLKEKCGGFFASSTLRYSPKLTPFLQDVVPLKATL